MQYFLVNHLPFFISIVIVVFFVKHKTLSIILGTSILPLAYGVYQAILSDMTAGIIYVPLAFMILFFFYLFLHSLTQRRLLASVLFFILLMICFYPLGPLVNKYVNNRYMQGRDKTNEMVREHGSVTTMALPDVFERDGNDSMLTIILADCIYGDRIEVRIKYLDDKKTILYRLRSPKDLTFHDTAWQKTTIPIDSSIGHLARELKMFKSDKTNFLYLDGYSLNIFKVNYGQMIYSRFDISNADSKTPNCYRLLVPIYQMFNEIGKNDSTFSNVLTMLRKSGFQL